MGITPSPPKKKPKKNPKKQKRTKPSAKFLFTTMPQKLGTTDANTPTAKKWIVIGRKRMHGFIIFFLINCSKYKEYTISVILLLFFFLDNQ